MSWRTSAIAVALLAFGGIYLIIESPTAEQLALPAIEQSGIPPLYTKGNKIVNSRTGEPMTFKGIVSERFRYLMNYNYPVLYGELAPELEKIGRLKRMGANINLIGLYLARLDSIKSNLDEIDAFINYARENDLYVYLAPTGNAFLETATETIVAGNKEFFKDAGPNDLTELTELLASRYGSYPNVFYQLAAEPNISYRAWEIKQKELAAIVRKYTDNPIIVSTPYYTPYSPLPALPYDNVIYSTGGYVSKNDRSFIERQINKILGEESLIQNYPVIVAEFGGNYGGDFSSARDLALFKDVLKEINRANLGYSAYRLSSNYANDGLALFDIEGELTQKGEIFVSSFNE